MNSRYAFNIKNRDFKIKKYLNHKAVLQAKQKEGKVSALGELGS